MKARKKRRSSRILLLSLPAFILFVTLQEFSDLAYEVYGYYEASDWKKTTGFVESTETGKAFEPGRLRFYPIVHYTFKLDGKTYRGSTFSQPETYHHHRPEVRDALAPYEKGELVTLHYDPENPENNALKRKAFPLLKTLLITPLCLGGIAAFIFLSLRVSKW